MRTLLLLAFAGVALIFSPWSPAPVAAQPDRIANIEVRVWQSRLDAARLFISARPAGGSWAELGTIPLDVSSPSSASGSHNHADIVLTVPLPSRIPNRTATIEVRVWQSRLDARMLSISARPADGSWDEPGTTPLDMSGLSASGAYDYGDIALTVPLPDFPAIVFWGEVSDATRTEVRERIAAIVEFFDTRYGIRVPCLEIHVGADDAAIAEATLDVEGKSTWVGFAQYRDGFLFVREDASD